VVSERISAVLTPLLGKQKAKQLLAEATATGQPLADVLADTATQLPVDDLLDPLRYTGAAGPLADRVLARYHGTAP
jgi:3-carboxy-cis,cis-muconate cycloisomerase